MNQISNISKYLDRQDWRVKANANLGFGYTGLLSSITGEVIANYWLDSVYSDEAGAAHRNGDIYIHDLDCLTGYCAGWSLRQMLDEGFNGVPGKVASTPPNHFRQALGQAANFLCVLQLEWAGAQAFSSFDTYLAPLIFKDKIDLDEVKREIRSFIFEVNVPMRYGQSPFTNITLDFRVPKDLRDQIPTAGGKHLFDGMEDEQLLQLAQGRDPDIQQLTDLTYGHFQQEMEMIDIAYYEVMTEGDARGQPFTFPIPTVNITEDFDWDSPVANALFTNTAKMGSSYFQNFIGSQYKRNENGEKVRDDSAYKPHDVRSMCCRLQLSVRELLKRGNGLFGSAELTGSLGVITLNMGRLGYEHKDSEEELLRSVERLMDVARDALEAKRKFIQEMYDRGLYPYTRRYLPHLRNHFNTIGVNGMNEMVRNFTSDRHNIADSEGIALAARVLDFMRELLEKYQEETGHLYNLEATPAEGATYRLAKEDKKRYPDILQAGFGENIYYTNSSQLPANFTDDPFEALTLQDDLQCKYTGGTVLHLYMGEKISSPEGCKSLVRKVAENFRLPYFTITPIFSVCEVHGYLEGEQEVCPKCERKTLVWTRVMGYYRQTEGFNKGKWGEHRERTYFEE